MPAPALADRIALIDALLPQTQCGLCQTPGCLPYAEAIAAGEAINRCVPGGQETVDALAALLEVPTLPVDTTHGVAAPHRLVAWIREPECIGCTKCIQACPVDAISGAAKLMHTVLLDECTGCGLCIPPCPVDCIDLVAGPAVPMTWHAEADTTLAAAARQRADLARRRHQDRLARLAARASAREARRQARATVVVPESATAPTVDAAQRMIAAAMARSQLKKAERQLAALQARGADSQALEAELPALRAAVAAAEAALASAG